MSTPEPQLTVPRTTFVERWIANPRKLLAYCLVLGAPTGAWSWLQYGLSSSVPSTLPGFGLLFAGLAYFSIAGCAGAQLLREAPSADRWAVAALVPQILQIQASGFFYKVVCGLHVTITVGAGSINLGFGALVGFSLLVQDLLLPAKVAINLVPVSFLWYFYHQSRSRLTSA